MGEYKPVRHHSEEFACPLCGELCCVGDEAFETGLDQFCSRICAERAHLDELELQAVADWT